MNQTTLKSDLPKNSCKFQSFDGSNRLRMKHIALQNSKYRSMLAEVQDDAISGVDESTNIIQ